MRSFVRRSIPLLAAAVAFSLVSPPSALAGLYRWVMPAGGAWDTGTNWSPTGYPHLFFDFAMFDTPGTFAIDATRADRVPGVGGIVVNAGEVRLRAHSALAGAVTLGTIGSPASLILESGGVYASAIHTVASSGTLVLGPGTSLESRVGGTVGFVVEAGGVLRGDGGSLERQTLRCFGTVSPGLSPATTGILYLGRRYPTGFDQRYTGVLEIELGGPEPGTGYDRLEVVSASAPITLSGTLRVSLLGGYVPDPGSAFDVVVAPAMTGTFAAVLLPSLPNREFSLEIASNRITVHVEGPSVIAAALDIHPGGCPNSLGVNKRGVVPVALLGSEGFDVADVDVASLALEGVPAIRASVEDVSAPYLGDLCGCSEDGPDGHPDLVLKFDAPALLQAIGGGVHGDEVTLTLTGSLHDGTQIEGQDCVRLVGGGRGSNGQASAAAPQIRPLSAPRETTQRVTAVLSETASVSFGVFDVSGRRVAQLWSGSFPAGEQIVNWDASSLPSGLYFYVLDSGAATAGARVLILR